MAILSINETTTFRWSFEEDVANYAAAGIRAIGVWRQKLSDCGLSKAKELLSQHGVQPSHMFWAGGFTGSEGHSYRESIEDTSAALQTAALLGAKCLVVCSGARSGHTFNHARRLVIGALKELLPRAEELGVIMAIEPMHPGCAAQCTFLNSLDDALTVLSAISSRFRKICARHLPLRAIAGPYRADSRICIPDCHRSAWRRKVTPKRGAKPLPLGRGCDSFTPHRVCLANCGL